jgi:hypothetical protein
MGPQALLVAALAFVGAGGGGCGPVLSVSTVANVGQQLPGQAAALDALPSHCLIFRQLDNGSPASCQQLDSDLKVVRKATEMLAEYSAALDRLAGAKAPDVKGDVASLLSSARQLGWRDLGADQASGLAQVAGGLVTFFSSKWRSEKLGDVVMRYDRDIQTVVGRIDQILEVETDTLTGSSGLVRQLARQVPIFVPGAPAEGTKPSPATAANLPHPVSVGVQATLYSLDQWSQMQVGAVTRFRQVVKAFGAAHGELAKNTDRLKNAALLAQIRSTLVDVARGASQLRPPQK